MFGRKNHFRGNIIFGRQNNFWPKNHCWPKKSFLASKDHFWRAKIIFGEQKSFLANKNHFWRTKIIFGEQKSFFGEIVFD